ncbi:hypothetical protein QTN25_010478 [Entamoeba marina]
MVLVMIWTIYFHDFLTVGEIILKCFVVFIGLVLASINIFFLLIHFVPDKRWFIGFGLFAIASTIILVIFIPISSVLTTLSPMSIWDIEPSMRQEQELENDCCYSTKEINITVNGGYYLEYDVFVDCIYLGDNSSFIDWNQCYYDHDQHICRLINTVEIDVCRTRRITAVFITYEVFIGLVICADLFFAISCFFLYYSIESEKQQKYWYDEGVNQNTTKDIELKKGQDKEVDMAINSNSELNKNEQETRKSKEISPSSSSLSVDKNSNGNNSLQQSNTLSESVSQNDN